MLEKYLHSQQIISLPNVMTITQYMLTMLTSLIQKYIITILSQLLILISALGLASWLTGIC